MEIRSSAAGGEVVVGAEDELGGAVAGGFGYVAAGGAGERGEDVLGIGGEGQKRRRAVEVLWSKLGEVASRGECAPVRTIRPEVTGGSRA